MTLNEFLAKAGNLLGLAEKNLNAETQLTQAQADLATAKTTIASLGTEIAGLKAEVETCKAAVTAAQAEVAAKEADVEARASAKALEITASQGQPPAPSTPATAQAGSLVEQFQAIEDPVKRAAFFKANRKAITAARKT